MKVHLIKKQSIENYVLKNARSKTSFKIWLSILKRVDWNDPTNIISTFNSADIPSFKIISSRLKNKRSHSLIMGSHSCRKMSENTGANC